MIDSSLMDTLDRLGFGTDVDELEKHIEEQGSNTADIYYNILRELKPNSEILQRNTDSLSAKSELPLIHHLSELDDFKNSLGNSLIDLFCYCKLNGHTFTAVYQNGKLVKGLTGEREITRHIKAVLPNHIYEWKDISLLEVTGELVVSLYDFNRYLKDTSETPLSALGQLLKPTDTETDLKYLKCVCYKVETEEIQFDSWNEQFEFLNSFGFETPVHRLYAYIDTYNLDDTIETVIEDFSLMVDRNNIGYETTGIEVLINDIDEFNRLSLNSFILKMGRHWEHNIYKSTIKDIEFIGGSKYFTPKAIIDPVRTVTGAVVTSVPLYNIGIMNDLKLLVGSDIYFKFDKETGVKLCTSEGDIVENNG